MRKKAAPVLAGMEELFRSGSIDQNRSSVNWPVAKALQRHGDAETGFKSGCPSWRWGPRGSTLTDSHRVPEHRSKFHFRLNRILYQYTILYRYTILYQYTILSDCTGTQIIISVQSRPHTRKGMHGVVGGSLNPKP
jgi:hypothetical protein